MEIRKEITENLLTWYHANARPLPWRADKDPYHVWVSEIMLQQTRVDTVIAYYYRFMENIPTIDILAKTSDDEIIKLWEGLGYYSRARNIKKAAIHIMENYRGIFPKTYGEILKLPGIGEYTAGAIASICFDEPVAAVDGNVLRIISRIEGIHENIDLPATRKRMKTALEKIYPKTQCGDFTQSLMELGAVVCLPNGEPKCSVCPVSALCEAKRHGTIALLPVKNSRKAKKKQNLTVFMLTHKGRFALERRDEKGLLSGMWAFPHISGKIKLEDVEKSLKEWDIMAESIVPMKNQKHLFTHIEWDMTCYQIVSKNQSKAFIWADMNELQNKYTLPTAFKKLIIASQ